MCVGGGGYTCTCVCITLGCENYMFDYCITGIFEGAIFTDVAGILKFLFSRFGLARWLCLILICGIGRGRRRLNIL